MRSKPLADLTFVDTIWIVNKNAIGQEKQQVCAIIGKVIKKSCSYWFLWRRWGSLLPGLRTLDPSLGPSSTQEKEYVWKINCLGYMINEGE